MVDKQVVDLPSDVFAEALLASGKVESSDTGILSLVEPDSEIPDGLTAEVLNMVSTDEACLSIPPPEVLYHQKLLLTACPLSSSFQAVVSRPITALLDAV